MWTDDDWLADVLPGERITEVTPLSGGYANENLLLVTARGDRYVLRHHVRSDASAVCEIEAALARRVAGVVPVPNVIAVRDNAMLSEFVPGELAGRVMDADPHGLGVTIGETLAAIGTVRFACQGFFTGPDLVPDPVNVSAGLAGFVASRVDGVLSDRERDVLVAHAEAVQPVLDSMDTSACLVHSDYNPKNVLVANRNGHWSVAAVLDWEFAFSGPPLVDVGNMLRFRADYPPGFADGFLTGYRAHAELPDGWQVAAQALDLFALADLLSRGPDSPLFGKVITLVRQRVAALGGAC